MIEILGTCLLYVPDTFYTNKALGIITMGLNKNI